ncbi:hypothetical protein N7499_010772 [Penicillium canescens]|uniref:Uncharacterized protein n=1 Tax=Penicillium canescens TaxID=5083 RepID=A0AAD6IIY3_PENCN|nr:uncharacterized protein N7446_006040 [Penicillium canescens]KAJ5990245.1 hypothetical protein N7522_010452 [Penicillium canescens]KAJ6051408.1 hypothetical protein N7460_001942 [Penicillium canescens]KAJ6061920.1 hypothetical protein N7446_006040 [Penicillium canescens]KAJ6065171.1 hypothetical protein N7444_000824 [Penicillium canescens]KAJ6068885.1 hypothetical protein N7499_010772 [Penicillium canescens]
MTTLLSLLRRECNGDDTVSSCTKPTSRALTVGVPAAITGVLLLTAIIVLVVLYYKRQRRDDREDLEDRNRSSGFYGRYAQQRFGGQGQAQGQGQRGAPTSSRRSSGESFFDYKQEDYGRYHMASFQEPEVPKPTATTRVVA